MANHRTARVLVVDDELELRRLVSDILAGLDVTICTAGSGKEALEAARSQAPDLLITDLRLGDCTGLDVIDDVRKLAGEVPAVVITGYGDPQSLAAASRRRPVEVMTKPLDVDRLRQTVQGELNRLDRAERLGRRNRRLRMIARNLSRDRNLVRGQLDSVNYILRSMPEAFGFDEEALDPIREVASRLHQDPGNYETGRDLMGLMLQLNQELDEEREDPNYPPKTRRDMLAFAGIARGVAEALRDIYYGDPAQVTTEDSELLMERGKVGFMQSQNKRVMRKRARQRVDAMKRLIDLTVKEMGGGERGADSVKKKLDAILKHKHGDDQVGDTIKRAKNTMNTYLKRYKVSKGVRRTLMGQFFALREDFGQGLVVPQWAQQHMTWAKANTGLDFWELGDEPEAPLERSAPKKPGSVNKVLRDLGQTISMPGMSMKKTRDLLADPFGVA